MHIGQTSENKLHRVLSSRCFLVRFSAQIPEVTEPPEGAELLASWEDHGNEENVVPDDDAGTTNETPEETSLPCTDTSGDASKSSAPHDDSGGTRKARKRPLTTARLLLESHKEEVAHTKKSEEAEADEKDCEAARRS